MYKYVIQSQAHKNFYLNWNNLAQLWEWREGEENGWEFSSKQQANELYGSISSLTTTGWAGKAVMKEPRNQDSDDWVDAQLYY